LGAARRSSCPGKALLFGFDDVPSYYLNCLVALRCKVRPGFRLVECHSVIQAVPFDDGRTLGSRPTLYLNNPSGCGAQSSTMGCLYQLPGGREVCGLGCRIEDFRFADRVSFQLGSLSVEALDRDSSNCDASEHYHCEFKIRSHGSPSDCGVSIQDDGSLIFGHTLP
jgi:hypothetical protein